MPDGMDLFKAEVKSINEIFSDTHNNCFVIPRFQRYYTWKENNIEALFDDIVSGIKNFDKEHMELFVSFLGAVIFTKSGDQYNNNHTDADFPAQTVIDGQQRFATIMFLASILYFKLLVQKEKFKSKMKHLEQEFADEINFIMQKLEEQVCQVFRMKIGNLYAPCLIRIPTDFWGRKQETARYKSDVANFYYDVISAIDNFDGDEGRTQIRQTLENIIEKSSPNIQPALNKINTCLNNIIEVKSKDYEESNDNDYKIDDVVVSNIICSFSNKCKRSEYFKKLVQNKPDEFNEIITSLRAIALARYFLTGIVVTIIKSNNPVYAYNIFDALNTSGQPLTVMDIFYASVQNDLDNNSSIEKKDEIINLLNDIRDTYSKYKIEDKVKDLVKFFALAYFSEKLGTKPVEQRRFLHKQYEQTENKYIFISNLHNSFKIYRDFAFNYKKNNTANSTIPIEALQKNKLDKLEIIDRLCLDLLCGSNPLAFAPLVLFYARYLEAKENTEYLNHFSECLRMAAAFSTLYRLFYKGTNRLDDVYRALMDEKFYSKKEKKSMRENIEPNEIREYLKEILEKRGLTDRDNWSTKVSKNDLFNELNQFTRFVLLILRDSTVLQDQSFLLSHGVRGFSVKNSDYYDYTIEHVAPQSPNKDDGWDNNIYKMTENGVFPVHFLGNFITLPNNLNNDLKNGSFGSKVAKAKCNYCNSVEEFDELLKNTPINAISNNQLKRDKEQSYDVLIMVDDINKHVWDLELIEKRSLNMAEMAHDCLIKLFNNNINKIYT